jgi:hypothetical protein
MLIFLIYILKKKIYYFNCRNHYLKKRTKNVLILHQTIEFNHHL